MLDYIQWKFYSCIGYGGGGGGGGRGGGKGRGYGGKGGYEKPTKVEKGDYTFLQQGCARYNLQFSPSIFWFDRWYGKVWRIFG